MHDIVVCGQSCPVLNRCKNCSLAFCIPRCCSGHWHWLSVRCIYSKAMLAQLPKRHQNRYAVTAFHDVTIKEWVYNLPEVTEMQQRLQ